MCNIHQKMFPEKKKNLKKNLKKKFEIIFDGVEYLVCRS